MAKEKKKNADFHNIQSFTSFNYTATAHVTFIYRLIRFEY